MKTIAVLVLSGVALAGACHVKESNEQTVTGTIAGVFFKATDAYAAQGASPAGNPPQQTFTVTVFVTDVQGVCGVASPPGGTTIEVTVTRPSAPVASGTYAADGGAQGVLVTAVLQRLDEGGRPLDVESATSGSVTMDIEEPNEVRGSLSLSFPRGSLSGTFVAPFSCAADAGRGDSAVAEGGPADGGPTDGATTDAHRPDGGEVDSGNVDSGNADSGNVTDAGPTDACVRRGDSGLVCE